MLHLLRKGNDPCANLVMVVSHMGSKFVFMCVSLATVVIRASMIILACVRTHVRAKVEI